jgi:ppGpp synthetase/RelA/SpoT-type nucleotidyltranferase
VPADADLRAQYERRRPLLETLARTLETGLREALDSLPHIDRVSFRAKSTTSYLGKASRYEHPLEDIEDQVAGRVLVFFTFDIDTVSAIARGRWTAVELQHKQPERDAEFGYETWHHIFVIPEHVKPNGWSEVAEMPKTFELQIRTLFMHAYAEPQHDFAYKSAAELPRDVRRQLGWIASSAWGADRAYADVVARIQSDESRY